MRLIDADKLLEAGSAVIINYKKNESPDTVIVRHGKAFKKLVQDAPTVDAVEVVRCKDCIYCTPVEGGLPLCVRYNTAVFYSDFCSCGERKENNE